MLLVFLTIDKYSPVGSKKLLNTVIIGIATIIEMSKELKNQILILLPIFNEVLMVLSRVINFIPKVLSVNLFYFQPDINITSNASA